MLKKCLITISILLFSLSFSQQKGKASFYSDFHHGKRTASGEIFNMNSLTCASNTYKMGTMLKVTNMGNGKSVTVKVNDTGGFGKYGRVIDLSKAAFATIASLKSGIINVLVEKLN